MGLVSVDSKKPVASHIEILDGATLVLLPSVHLWSCTNFRDTLLKVKLGLWYVPSNQNRAGVHTWAKETWG